MKKCLFTLACALTCALMFAQASRDDAAKRLLSSDARVADNARLELESMGAADELLAALDKIGDKKLKGGVIYSLGCIKCQKAYPIISRAAFSGKDDCPAAVLALAYYADEKAAQDLAKLDAEGCVTAKAAIFLMAKPGADRQPAWEAFDKAFQNASERAKIRMLRNLPKCEGSKDILMRIIPSNDNISKAWCFALARMGGADCAKKIVAEAKNRPNASLENALAECAQSDAAIIEAIAARDITAFRAARLRACSEAEAELIKAVSECRGKALSEAFAALEAVGSKATLEAFAPSFRQIDKSKLPNFVKVLSAALKRVDDDAKQKAVNLLTASVGNSSDEYKAALDRILSAVKKS